MRQLIVVDPGNGGSRLHSAGRWSEAEERHAHLDRRGCRLRPARHADCGEERKEEDAADRSDASKSGNSL